MSMQHSNDFKGIFLVKLRVTGPIICFYFPIWWSYCTSSATISAPIVDIDTTTSIFSAAHQPAHQCTIKLPEIRRRVWSKCSSVGFAVKINVTCSSKLFLCSFCMNIARSLAVTECFTSSITRHNRHHQPELSTWPSTAQWWMVHYCSWTSICMIIPSASVKQALPHTFAWHVKTLFYFQFHTNSPYIRFLKFRFAKCWNRRNLLQLSFFTVAPLNSRHLR